MRLYKIDLQAYFRKMHGITGVEGLDVSLIQPDKTWTLKPENYAKYKPLEQDVEIPFKDNEAGAYVVTIGDDDWESTVLVLRSDLEVIVKASRREVLAFVQDMRTGKPAKDVELLVSNGSAVAATGKTGADGVFKTSLDELKDLGDVRVFALRSGHAAAFNLPLAGLQLSSGLKSKGYLYTDRPAYLPGETVSMRGILRDVKSDAYAIPENPDFKIRFSDPQGRLLSEQAVKLGRFGTFDATLALPEQAAIGTYTMTASQEIKGRETLQFQGTFEVREFKLEKIKLTMDFPRRVWFRGEKIEAGPSGRLLLGRTARQPRAALHAPGPPHRTHHHRCRRQGDLVLRHHRHDSRQPARFHRVARRRKRHGHGVPDTRKTRFLHRRKTKPTGGHRGRTVRPRSNHHGSRWQTDRRGAQDRRPADGENQDQPHPHPAALAASRMPAVRGGQGIRTRRHNRRRHRQGPGFAQAGKRRNLQAPDHRHRSLRTTHHRAKPASRFRTTTTRTNSASSRTTRPSRSARTPRSASTRVSTRASPC